MTVTVHWRQADAGEREALRELLEVIVRSHSRLKVFAGEACWELRARASWNKGDALRQILAHLHLTTADTIYLGEEFTAKDFRTWGGTLVAAIALAEHGPAETEAEAKRVLARVMRTVGERLGNTPAVARASYVSPAVIEQYLDGRTIEDFRPRHLRVVGARDIGLDREEQALLSLLRSWRIRRALLAA